MAQSLRPWSRCAAAPASYRPALDLVVIGQMNQYFEQEIIESISNYLTEGDAFRVSHLRQESGVMQEWDRFRSL
jgi:S-adenosylmethionine:tRNA-ribosyltransferase-isomerase (queuine synthetase)